MTKVKEYSNGEVTIVWKPDLCIHAAECVKRLPEVYDPKARPWIQPENASTDALMEQINACPSGALTYYKNNEQPENTDKMENQNTRIEVLEKGPLIVHGTVKVVHKDGTEEVKETRCSLCRCGASAKKPYCDGSHRGIEFEG